MMDFGAQGEENITSASDMVALVREIWAGSALAGGSGEFALELLLDQRLAPKLAVPPPTGARYAHKTGDLDGVENDAGIFFVPDRSFAMAEGAWACGPCVGRVYERFSVFMHEPSGAMASMHMQLDNVSVPRLQCR